jgi:hypothetical protein
MIFRKALKLFGWFFVTLILLVVDIFYLARYTQTKKVALERSRNLAEISMQLNAPFATGEVLGTSVAGDDARQLLVKNFILRYNPDSPFLQHVTSIVNEADRNHIDFRLLPAIAMCESNLGARMPTHDSYNAWGIAVFTGQLNGKKFDNWEHSIMWVSNYIREKFFDRGITDLREVGSIWAPPSVEKDYSWTRCVERFMEDMK